MASATITRDGSTPAPVNLTTKVPFSIATFSNRLFQDIPPVQTPVGAWVWSTAMLPRDVEASWTVKGLLRPRFGAWTQCAQT